MPDKVSLLQLAFRRQTRADSEAGSEFPKPFDTGGVSGRQSSSPKVDMRLMLTFTR